LIRIFGWAIRLASDWKIGINLTNPLQVPVDEIEAMEVVKPMCDID